MTKRKMKQVLLPYSYGQTALSISAMPLLQMTPDIRAVIWRYLSPIDALQLSNTCVLAESIMQSEYWDTKTTVEVKDTEQTKVTKELLMAMHRYLPKTMKAVRITAKNANLSELDLFKLLKRFPMLEEITIPVSHHNNRN